MAQIRWTGRPLKKVRHTQEIGNQKLKWGDDDGENLRSIQYKNCELEWPRIQKTKAEGNEIPKKYKNKDVVEESSW